MVKKYFFVIFFICFFVVGQFAYGKTDGEQFTQQSYVLRIVRKGDSVELREQAVAQGSYQYFPEFEKLDRSGYNGTVISFSGKVLGYFNFTDIESILCEDYVENGRMRGGCNFVGVDGEYVINAPYFSNARYIEVYSSKGIFMGRLDVLESAHCNENFQCDQNESPLDCPSDCGGQKEDFAMPIQPNENIVANKKTLFSEAWILVFWFVIFIGILAIVIWIIRAYRKWKKYKYPGL